MDATRPYLVISADCHAELPTEQYRAYVDPAYREDFEEYLKERAAQMAAGGISDITTIIVNAGYSNVRGLYEGCDNLWRGHAMMNGMDVSIMVTPSGGVIPNGY